MKSSYQEANEQMQRCAAADCGRVLYADERSFAIVRTGDSMRLAQEDDENAPDGTSRLCKPCRDKLIRFTEATGLTDSIATPEVM